MIQRRSRALPKLSHAALIKLAAAWAGRRRDGPPTPEGHLSTLSRCTVVFCEMVTTVTSEVPDCIGWDCYGQSTLVEAKTTRADFRADRKKDHVCRMGHRRYYLTPVGLLEPATVPDGWGLLFTTGKRVMVAKHAVPRELSGREAQIESAFLTAAIRRHELRVPWRARERKFEPYSRRRASK